MLASKSRYLPLSLFPLAMVAQHSSPDLFIYPPFVAPDAALLISLLFYRSLHVAGFRTRKQEKVNEKLTAYQEAEKIKMAALLAMAKASRQEGSLWQT